MTHSDSEESGVIKSNSKENDLPPPKEDVNESNTGNKIDPLTLRARSSFIEDIYEKGFLDAKAHDAALKFIQPSPPMWNLLNPLFLFLGAALVLSGIVFFFAFNWESISPFIKFSMIEVGIVICTIAAVIFSPKKIAGKLFLLSAALLVGVFLAVFGQIYQTGADAYELFMGWAVLIAGWVVVSQFAALWFMFLCVINAGIIFFWYQSFSEDSYIFYMILAFVNIIGIAGFLLGRYRKISWLNYAWYSRLILTAVYTYLYIPSFIFIVGVWSHASGLPLLMLGAVLGLSYWIFRFLFPDIVALTLTALCANVTFLTAVGKLLFGSDPKGDLIYLFFLIFGIIIIASFSGITIVLRKILKSMEMKGENADA